MISKIKLFSFPWWFVGFFEGDGSFVVDNSNNRCFLIINQKDIKVLTFIRSQLKVGSIKEYDGIHRWVISSKEDLFEVIQLLNGKLLLDKTNMRLKAWIASYNEYFSLSPGDPQFLEWKGAGEWDPHNSWFSGFLDAEGCFNIRIVALAKRKEEFLAQCDEVKSEDRESLAKQDPRSWHPFLYSSELTTPMSFRVRLRLIIKQKYGEKLFQAVKSHYHGQLSFEKKKPDICIYTLDANSRQIDIIKYLEVHPLQSIKHIDFLKFRNTYDQLNKKEHLSVTNKSRIITWLSRNQ
jgi:hypothetical protein